MQSDNVDQFLIVSEHAEMKILKMHMICPLIKHLKLQILVIPAYMFNTLESGPFSFDWVCVVQYLVFYISLC